MYVGKASLRMYGWKAFTANQIGLAHRTPSMSNCLKRQCTYISIAFITHLLTDRVDTQSISSITVVDVGSS